VSEFGKFAVNSKPAENGFFVPMQYYNFKLDIT